MDPNSYLILSAASLIGTAMLTFAGLKGWRGWLDLKARELTVRQPAEPGMTGASAGSRIEIADLKERIRKLEAIAAGVDL